MSEKSKEGKVTEEATFPGVCYICGHMIYVGDVIVRSMTGITPTAAHAVCEPGFEVGGARAPKVGESQ